MQRRRRSRRQRPRFKGWTLEEKRCLAVNPPVRLGIPIATPACAVEQEVFDGLAMNLPAARTALAEIDAGRAQHNRGQGVIGRGNFILTVERRRWPTALSGVTSHVGGVTTAVVGMQTMVVAARGSGCPQDCVSRRRNFSRSSASQITRRLLVFEANRLQAASKSASKAKAVSIKSRMERDYQNDRRALRPGLPGHQRQPSQSRIRTRQGGCRPSSTATWSSSRIALCLCRLKC